MLGGRGVRTRASRLRALATSTTHPPSGGFWQQWEREQWERDQLWEEAQQRLRVERAAQSEEWERIRTAWKNGATELPKKERVKFWFEGGSYRAATPEQASAWYSLNFHSGGGATHQSQHASADLKAPGDKRGFYAALGLVSTESRRADAAALQAAFRRTVLENHPDTAPSNADEEARTRRFRAAVAAWDVLRDKTQRERYDRE